MSKTSVKANHFDALLKPVVTEKATLGSEHGQVTFQVPMSASKSEIKQAVEAIFGVKVTGVNTLRQVGKIKRFRGKLGKRPDYKKAVVSLAEGETIDVTSGV